MGFLRDTWYLFLRLARATVRMPVFLLIAVVQPILWVVLFGQLFGAVTRLSGFGAASYVQYLAPGIAIMTALFGAAYSGLGLLGDIDRGVLDRILASPASRGAIVASRLLQSATQVVLQSAIILAVAALLGARPRGGAAGLACLLLAAGLLGAALAAFSNALALLARRQEVVIAAMNFVVLPATFLSSMMMSPGLMPSWIQAAARFNPVNWAVVAARDGFEGLAGPGLFLRLGLLAAFAAACAALAVRAFERYRRAL
jgi:ABC-2 type transport system permease protein